MKSSCLILLALGATLPAAAQLVTEATRTYTVGYNLADPQNPPQVFSQTISDSAILDVTGVVVGLNLVGTTPGSGFAGDIFVSLTKDLSLTSVLLNQVGVTAANPVGQGYDGWHVSFQDGAAGGDIHNATLAAGDLSGAYEPDGRIGPTDTDRPALLDVFDGTTGNGVWSLNVADLGLGSSLTLESWSLTLTGDTAVPEPATWAAGVAVTLAGLWQWRRRRRQ